MRNKEHSRQVQGLSCLKQYPNIPLISSQFLSYIKTNQSRWGWPPTTTRTEAAWGPTYCPVPVPSQSKEKMGLKCRKNTESMRKKAGLGKKKQSKKNIPGHGGPPWLVIFNGDTIRCMHTSSRFQKEIYRESNELSIRILFVRGKGKFIRIFLIDNICNNKSIFDYIMRSMVWPKNRCRPTGYIWPVHQTASPGLQAAAPVWGNQNGFFRSSC